jgi:hypothetical protein
MKRILFYTGVALAAICLTGGFVTIFWLLISTMTAMIAGTEFSALAALFLMPLLVLLFLVLTAFMFFSVGFFIYRADLFYRMRTRAFKVLRNDTAENWGAPTFFPEPYFAGGGFGYFAQSADASYANYGAPPAEEQGWSPRGRKKGLFRGKRDAGDKRQISLVKGGGISQGEDPVNRNFLPGFSASRGDNIRPFPRQPKNHHKR